MEKNNTRLDWSVVKNALQNHWFETDPTVSDNELDQTAIGVAGEIDEHIKKTHKASAPKTRDGIKEYTPLQKEPSRDIIRLLKSKRYKEMPGDDCQIVFGRVYSMYVTSKLIKNGKLRFASPQRGVKK